MSDDLSPPLAHRPFPTRPFSVYTARELWTDEHISARMLAYHLDGTVDISSRKTEFIDRSVTWIATRFGLSPETAVADFGCGPGLYATRLARRGARVTGIDFSPRSLDHARGVAADEELDIEYVLGDYLEFETDRRFDLVIMIMCDFCALGPDQRGHLLRRFAEILKPGGAVLLDVYSEAAFGRRESATVCERNLMDGFWSPTDYLGFQHTIKYAAEKVVLDHYTILDPSQDPPVVLHTIYNWLQYFTPEALRREFEDAGFSVEEILGDVAGAPYSEDADEFAVIARKA